MGTLANYSYDAVGNVSQITRSNGVISTFGYDDLHRLTSIQHKQGTTMLSQFNYALSADGKRNTLQEYIKYPASQPVSSVNRTVFYGYDNAGRLSAEQRQSTATLTAGGTQGNTSRTLWTYDNVGNRQTQVIKNYDGIGVDSPSVLKSTFNTAYSYNNNDWLTSTTSVKDDDSGESTSTTNFEYNANGSQTAVTSNVGKTEEQRLPYFYDFEQKLTSIGNPTDTVKHAYAYDADGNRVAESNTTGSGTDVRNYLVDPNNSNAQIVEEYNNTNTLLAHYDWNDAELLREASRNADESTFTIREPFADGHNSTRQLLDSTGAISDVYAFDAWGNQQENVGSAFNPYRYNSQRLDVSGLYYLRARQYSSGIGRFLTHDPLMGRVINPITQHRYLYAGDDGVNMIDPSGEDELAEFSVGEAGMAEIDGVGMSAFENILTRGSYQITRAFYFAAQNQARIQFWASVVGVTGVGLEGLGHLSQSLHTSLPNVPLNRAPDSPWNLPPVLRGHAIENRVLGRTPTLGGVTSWNYPVIDDFDSNGNATSIKSMDLRAAKYQNMGTLEGQLDIYADKLQNWEPQNYGSVQLEGETVNSRNLIIVLERGAATEEQASIILNWAQRAESTYPGLLITIGEYAETISEEMPH